MLSSPVQDMTFQLRQNKIPNKGLEERGEKKHEIQIYSVYIAAEYDVGQSNSLQ